jgi:hypothetical protein
MDSTITYSNTGSNNTGSIKCNIKFISKCYNCTHREVCGYKDEYNKLLKDVEKTVNCKSYNKMFSLSVDCKHYKDNNFNMINYKGYDISPYPYPINVSDGGDTILDPSKITVTGDDHKDLTVTLKNECKKFVVNTDNKVNLESKDGFHNYYTDKDVFS